MSVINQVLNQLEQRGAYTASEQTMVRAVPHSKRKFAMPLLALGLALTAGIAVWQWVQQPRKPVLSSVEGQNVAVGSIAPKTPQGFSHPEGVGNSLSSYEPEKLTPQHPPAVAVAAPASGVLAGEAPVAEMLPPASRLSFELSSVPLPSTLRPFDKAQDRPFDKAQDRLRSGQTLRQGSGQALLDVKNSPVLSAVEGPVPGKTKESSKPLPTQTVTPNTKTAVQTSGGELPMKQVSPAQQADAEFRKAAALMQQGRSADAVAGYEAVLRLDAGHDAARQALVALLLEGKRGADAERVLQEGLKSKPEHSGFAMLLARLQVERGAVDQATATLESSLSYADQQAAYQAFFAALLQRQNRHKEAITHYQIALQLAQNNGIWLMGYGISLQAVQRTDDAKDAFRRALDSKTLSPELQAFVQMKIKEL